MLIKGHGMEHNSLATRYMNGEFKTDEDWIAAIEKVDDQAKARLIELVESCKPKERKLIVDKFNQGRLSEAEAANYAYNAGINEYYIALIKAIKGGSNAK